jgi:N-acetylmuramoyl-L-alanine amidase
MNKSRRAASKRATREPAVKLKFFFAFFLLLSLPLSAILLIPEAGAEGPLDGRIICLDPGHGGVDPGAINTTYNLEESDINLEVSYGLRYLLEGDGATVVMARTADQYLINSDRYDFCNQQEADILISVHTNSHTDPTWDGSMTLYGPHEP